MRFTECGIKPYHWNHYQFGIWTEPVWRVAQTTVRQIKMDKQTIQALKGYLLEARALRDSMEQSLASTSNSSIFKYASFKTYVSSSNKCDY